MDLAVTRHIEAEGAEFDEVLLHTLDDLHSMAQGNLDTRSPALAQAEAIIETQVG